jgi:hypothetical protein
MSALSEMIKKEIVDPVVKNRIQATIGTVLKYDAITNTADIEYSNPSGGRSVDYNVPCGINSPGFHTIDLKPGDNVNITFVNGEITSPRIVGIYSAQYHEKGLRPTIEYGPTVPDIFSFL